MYIYKYNHRTAFFIILQVRPNLADGKKHAQKCAKQQVKTGKNLPFANNVEWQVRVYSFDPLAVHELTMLTAIDLNNYSSNYTICESLLLFRFGFGTWIFIKN